MRTLCLVSSKILVLNPSFMAELTEPRSHLDPTSWSWSGLGLFLSMRAAGAGATEVGNE